MESKDATRWELIDLDILQRPAGDIALDERAVAYVIVWADYRPVAIEELRPVNGRISRQELDALARRYRLRLRTLDWPKYGFRPFASVIVCTYRRDEPLRAILSALDEQEYGEFEIVVVDNAPQEAPTGQIVAGVPRARYIHEPHRGICRARNAGVRAARSDLIAFIDDDCFVHRHWLAAIMSGFQDRGVACCTGPILPRQLRTPAQRLLETRSGFNRGFERRVFSTACADARALCLPLHAYVCGSGANMAFRKSVLDGLGGFSEELPTAEDIDAFFRVMRHGYKILYEPAAAVRHDHPASYASLQRRMRDWGRGYVAYLLKIAATDPAHRGDAMADVRNWFLYQARRLWPQLLRRDPFPAGLTIRELAGGVAGLMGFGMGRMRAKARRARRRKHTGDAVIPHSNHADAPDLRE